MHIFGKFCRKDEYDVDKNYVAVSKAKFPENLHFVLSSPDEIAFILTSCVCVVFFLRIIIMHTSTLL